MLLITNPYLTNKIMKISKLIKHLQETLDQFGDKHAQMEDPDGGGDHIDVGYYYIVDDNVIFTEE